MNKYLNHTIGMRLRASRISSNLTTFQLADLVGTSSDAILELERGDQRIPPSLLVALAAELAVPVFSFFGDLVSLQAALIKLH